MEIIDNSSYIPFEKIYTTKSTPQKLLCKKCSTRSAPQKVTYLWQDMKPTSNAFKGKHIQRRLATFYYLEYMIILNFKGIIFQWQKFAFANKFV